MIDSAAMATEPGLLQNVARAVGADIPHYKVNEKGAIVWANLIVATGHNNLAVNRSVEQLAKRFVDATS